MKILLICCKDNVCFDIFKCMRHILKGSKPGLTVEQESTTSIIHFFKQNKKQITVNTNDSV